MHERPLREREWASHADASVLFVLAAGGVSIILTPGSTRAAIVLAAIALLLSVRAQMLRRQKSTWLNRATISGVLSAALILLRRLDS